MARNSASSLRDRLIHGLANPRLPLYAAVVAMLLTLPGLFIGFQLDDHFHRRFMLQSEQMGVSPWQVFASLNGDSTTLHRLVDTGVLPWWTASNFRLAFCRYLSTATMMLDYRLWPDHPVLMHAHSLLWYGALVLMAGVLLRRLLARAWVAGIAMLLYALDEAHAVPASWLANRNALIATTLGLAALWAHDRWRRDGWRPGAVLSALLILAGLFSGEMALATLAFIAAYAMALESGTRRSRMVSFLPALAASGLWILAYRLLELGAQGSGFYLDPLHEPLAYAKAVFHHAPILLLGQWTPVAAELGMLLPPASQTGLWVAGIAVSAILVALLWNLVRTDRSARFFALGTAGALLPISAVAPSNRLLFFAGFGCSALLALLLAAFVDRAPWISPSILRRRLTALCLAVFLFFHLVVAPLAKPFVAYSTKPLGGSTEIVAASIPDELAPGVEELVFVNAPDYLFDVSNALTLKALAGKPLPLRIRALVCGPTKLELRRPDDHTLFVHAEQGMFQGTVGRLFRSKSDPLCVGDTILLTGLAIAILEVDESGDPTTLSFAFGDALEDRSRHWLLWSEDRYGSFMPPVVGDSLALPPSYGSLDLFWH